MLGIRLGTDLDADPGGPKTYGSSGSGCGFGTLVHFYIIHQR
jgi:hypothetical protein